MTLSRQQFHESDGDPILGYTTREGVVCRDCAQNNAEFADINPKMTYPIHLRDVGEGSGAYPDGFTCTGCSETVGDWDYRGDR